MAKESISIESYKCIFEILNTLYYEYCVGFLNTLHRDEQVNLKRKTVCDIYDFSEGLDQAFKDYIYNYMVELPILQLDILDEIKRKCGTDIGARIKSIDSVVDKLFRKCGEKEGKFPINKVLNDLLGFRIIDSNYGHNIMKIDNQIDIMRQQKYKIRSYLRQDKDYEAYHIYFRGSSNNIFPIELQIWDSELEQKNMISHNKYKQGYLADWKRYQRF